MENSQALLSICIPTYNRSKILNGNLSRIHNQIKGNNLPIEIIVSDNCSTDNTIDVVRNHISEGMPINYIRNSENLGMDGNFAQCYRKANGKYILVLGDDDYLIDGKLKVLIDYLRKGDYGLIHLKITSSSSENTKIYDNSEEFLKNISFWITYITSNIVNSKYVKNYNFEQYSGTYLAIMPLYLTSAINHDENLMIFERIFSDGLVSNTNGGYNFFKVFIVNYLSIWHSFVKKQKISFHLYKWIKRDILKHFLIERAYILLIKKEVNNYHLENSWNYILKNYSLYVYFYFEIIVFFIKKIIRGFKHKFLSACQ